MLARAKTPLWIAWPPNGVLYAQKGVVHLLERAELPDKTLDSEKTLWLLTQQLTRAMETGGVEACAEIVAGMFSSGADRAKALAYRLFTIAEQKGWAQEAYAYNSLVIAWPDIQARVAGYTKRPDGAGQVAVDFDSGILTMPSILFGDLPLVTSESELDAEKASHPDCDPYFIASGCIERRRELI